MLDGLPSSYGAILRGPGHARIPQLAVMADPDTAWPVRCQITAGTVSVDRTAANRRRITVTLVDDDRIFGTAAGVTPSSPSDPVTPYGTILRPSCLLGLPGTDQAGWAEIPLGTMRVSNVKTNGDGTVEVTASDHSRTVGRNKLTAPYVIPAGTNYGDAITALVRDRLGDLYVAGSVATTDETTPLITIDSGEDPWQHATDMAATVGMDAYFDPLGRFTMQPTPDPAQQPVDWTYAEGENMLLDAAVELDDDPGFNGVVMTGEGSTLPAPVSATVWDGNPESPTYYLGPYGRVPDFQSSPLIANTAQATARAQKYLQDNAGVTEAVTFSAIPNPAHEAGDIVQVTRTRARVDGLFAVESFDVPLMVADSMPVTCVKRRAFMPALDTASTDTGS